MMDIEGLINDREQSGLHLPTNPFALPTATSSNSGSGGGGPPSSSPDRDAMTLASFTFPTLSPTLAENSDFSDSFHLRKRTSRDVGGGPRANPPGRKKSQPKSQDAGRTSSTKDYPRRRALQACQICRARKTKCDNERPSCGSCEALGVECSYNEAPASR